MSDPNTNLPNINAPAMTSNAFIGPRGDVQVMNVRTSFTLNDVTVTNIVHDPDKIGFENIPSMEALRKTTERTMKLYDEVAAWILQFRNPYLISDPLISTNYIDKNVVVNNISLDKDQSTIVKKTTAPPYALAIIRSDAFPSPGMYYLEIDIIEMSTDSKIVVTNERNEIIKEIYFAGKHKNIFHVEIPSITTLTISVEQLPDDGKIVLGQIYLYAIRDNIDRYMQYIQEQASGIADAVTMPQVLQLISQNINTALVDMRAYVNAITSAVQLSADEHAARRDNPHNVSWNQTGAAKVNHTHTPTECGAAPTSHQHPLTDINFGAVDLGALLGHPSRTDNPHGVTKTQVGLGNIPNSISDDPTKNNSSILATTKATNAVMVALATHKADTNNPHDTNKTQVGLGNVENYPPATLLETINGTGNDKYNTPENTKEAFTAWANSGVDISKIQPKPIYQFTFTGESVNIPVVPNRIYTAQITTDTNSITSDIDLQFSFKTNPVMSVYSYNNAVAYTSGTAAAPIMAYKELISPKIQLIPNTFGHNYGNGSLRIDTANLQISGDLTCKIIDPSTFNFTSPRIFQHSFHANLICNTPSELQNIPGYLNSIIFSTSTNNDYNVRVTIYEHLLVHNQPVVVIDAAPVGFQCNNPGTRLYPGYAFMDGSELNRSQYDDLFKFVTNNDLMVSNAVYLDHVTTNKDLYKYSAGNGTTTFRLPRLINVHEEGIINSIKISSVVVPDHSRVLYELASTNEQTIDLP